MENALHRLKKMIASPSQFETTEAFRLTEVLLGMAMPAQRTLAHDISFFDDSLNDSQMAAVKFALEAVEVACIHGPPGEYLW
jgi:DNA polymerase alpha-associated DNA helicase A